MSMKFLKTVAGAAVSSLWEKVSGNIVPKDTDADVGIGTDGPITKFHVVESALTSAGTSTGDIATFENDGNSNLNLIGSTAQAGAVLFSDTTRARGLVRYNHGAVNTGTDSMEFAVNGASTKLTIRADGDIRVDSGNLIIGTAGKGIDFSAQTATTTGTTTAELLDHYEEGTWTPAITGPSSISYSTQTGVYTRIGNQVTVQFHVRATWTASGAAVLTGLPFTVGTSGSTLPLSYQSFETGITAEGYVVAGGTTANFYELNALSVTWAPSSGTNQYIIGSGSYFV